MTDRPVQDTAFGAERAIHLAQDTFDIEAAAILGLKQRIGTPFAPSMGIFTDGDLRTYTALQAMHASPYTIPEHALAAEAAQLMERHRITSVLVVDDDGKLCGAVNSNDLMRAKVI